MRRTTPFKVLVLFAIVIAAATTALSAAAAAARPWLGVYTQEVTSDLRDGLDLHDDGVLVNRVVDGSPAERAGLRKGDLIMRFNSRAVDSPEALSRMVGDAHNGQAIALEILRHGDRQTLSVTLAPRPSDDDGESMAPAPPDAPDAPEPPEAPRAPGDRDDNGDRAQRHMRLRVVTPDGEHGTPHVYRFDGDMSKLPDDVQRMLGDMHFNQLDGDGARRIAVSVANRARLGVRIESMSDDLAAALDAPGREGVLVLQVMQDTPAERAGLKAGDVIVGVNDKGVSNAEELQKALHDVDGKVSLSVSRKGSRRTIEAELGSPSRAGREEDESLGSGRREGLESLGRLRARGDAGGDDLRKQLEELRQQVRELRQQLEDQKDHH